MEAAVDAMRHEIASAASRTPAPKTINAMRYPVTNVLAPAPSSVGESESARNASATMSCVAEKNAVTQRSTKKIRL